MYISTDQLNPFIYLNFITAAVFLATLQDVEDPKKWAHIPILAGFVTFITSFFIMGPFMFQFLFDPGHYQVVFVEIGWLYFVFALLELGLWATVTGYWLYLKLGWFESLFGMKKGAVI